MKDILNYYLFAIPIDSIATLPPRTTSILFRNNALNNLISSFILDSIATHSIIIDF